MPGRTSESKTRLIKRIVDIDVELAANKSMTAEHRSELIKLRKRLEKRLYPQSSQ